MKTIIKLTASLLVMFSLLLTACQSLDMPVYDAQTDKMLTETQAMTDRLFIDIEYNIGLKKNRYAIYKEQYKTILTRLYVIQTRVAAQAHNQTSRDQLAILIDTIRKLQTRHKLGFKNVQEVRGLQRLVDSQFQSVLKLELAKPKRST